MASSDLDESRRQFLLFLLSTGALAALPRTTQAAAYNGGIPTALPPGQSIFEMNGSVTVNGKPASLSTPITPGDLVETGINSFVIFVVEKDAFILRSSSRMRLPGRVVPSGTISTAYMLEQGAALSVLASRRTNISTPNAVVGVRGTGVYVETDPERSYVCVCYGTSDLATADNPGINETIVSEHHTAPRYILADPNAGERIVPAPFINHDDQELLLVETLVGRTTPYMVPKSIPRTRNSYI